MIVKVIVRRALKGERFYLPGETLFPPFSPDILSEIRAGRGMVDVYSVSDEEKRDQKKLHPVALLKPSGDATDETVKTVVRDLSGREILFRKFESMGNTRKIVVTQNPYTGKSPPWFVGRYTKKYKQLLFRQFDKLEG
jgi:hypothetical protein